MESISRFILFPAKPSANLPSIMKSLIGSIFLLLALVVSAPVCKSAEYRKNGMEHLPKGIILNLDFQQIRDGLIPNKALYPLHVPTNGLGTETVNQREILVFKEGKGLDIPHSSLLDPDGTSWVVSIRMLALADGIIMSQCNDTSGYVIYLKDGVVHATIRSGYSTTTLRERPGYGIGNVFKKQVSIDLRIERDFAFLILNRTRVATTSLQKPLAGNNHLIRIGGHTTVPIPLKRNPAATPTGFAGGISSFKILRQ